MDDVAPPDDSWSPAVRTDLHTEGIDGELVIFDPLTSEVHQLDPLGTIIWPFLDGEATVGELVLDLAAAFEVPEARVRDDLGTLLATLSEHRLIEGQQPEQVEQPALPELGSPSYLVDPPAP